MESVYLKGGKMFLTDQTEMAFRVDEGHVLIYIVPYAEGKPGRRFLLYEAEEGDKIPAFAWEHEQLGIWRFGLVALEEARIHPYKPENMDEEKMEFAKLIQLRLFSADEFEEEIAEQYNINIIKEEGYIYAASLEQESTYEKGLQIILDMFRKKRHRQNTPKSGNRMYDAAAFVCDFMGVYIAPFEKVK
ncbi:hypothetical protein, partial [Blautia hydrogenotrophica]